MKKYIAFLVLALSFYSCETDSNGNVIVDLTCDYIDFKYYNDQPDPLGDMSQDYILIAVDNSYEDSEIDSYISGISFFDQSYSYTIYNYPTDDFKLIPLKFNVSKSCEILGLAINYLEDSEMVRYAHYTMETDDCTNWIDESLGSLCVNSYSSYFYVRVIDENDLTGLNSLVALTNTDLVEQNQFMPKWFTLRAYKESNGDALAMANFFYESGLIDTAEPNLMKFGVED